jgi:hypothetical protein
MAVTETTKLSAINSMLSCIGESPVSSLDGTVSADVAVASNILDEVCRDLMQREWRWNTIKNQTLSAQVDGKVPVPANWVRVDHDTKDYAKRGPYLYNRTDSTDVFSGTVTGLKAILFLDWDEMPEAAKRYALIRAGRTLAARMVGSEKIVGLTARDEAMAMMTLREYESEQGGFNIFDNPDIASNLRRWA